MTFKTTISMKKILSLVVLLMTTVATFAQVFTDEAHVTSAGMTTDYQSKEVELTKVSDDLYTLTFRKLAPMAYKTFGDFTVSNVKATADAATGDIKFTTESTEGVWSNVTSTAAIGGVTEGSSAQLNSLEATLSADGTKLTLEFCFVTLGSDVNVLFGTSTSTAIVSPDAAADNRYVAIYTLGGVRRNSLQRGINIVRTASGKVKKVLVK